MAYYDVSGFLLLTLIILRDLIRVGVYKVSLVYLITITFSTLACLLVDPLFGLSFDKEVNEVIKILYLRD